jgi:hypothetical protein
MLSASLTLELGRRASGRVWKGLSLVNGCTVTVRNLCSERLEARELGFFRRALDILTSDGHGDDAARDGRRAPSRASTVYKSLENFVCRAGTADHTRENGLPANGREMKHY